VDIYGQTAFALKMTLKYKVVKCRKYITYQVTMGSIVPIFPVHRISGIFLKNNSGTIPFVSENQETLWKHRFSTFFLVYKINKSKPLGSGPPRIPQQGFNGTVHLDKTTLAGIALEFKLAANSIVFLQCCP